MKTKIALVLTILTAAAIFPQVISAAPDIDPRTGAVNGAPNYKIAAILVTFSDNPTKPQISKTEGDWTKSYVNGVLFSNTDSMAAFYADASGGRITVTGDVYDNGGQWYTIPRPANVDDRCDWGAFFPDAVAAADADIDFTQYNTIMVFAPQLACSTGGYAASVIAPDTGGLWYRATDVDGYMGSVPHHELGHVIGMSHANSWTCDAPNVLTGTNCLLEEYGDRYDVMGLSSRMLQPSAPHKENLGWLTPAEITTVTADGDYTIQAYEIAGAVPKVLKIPQARDVNGDVTSWYYLEYRKPITFDNIPRTPTIQELGVPNGVMVHLGSGTGEYITTTLLDMTPGSLPGHDIFDPALPLGSSYDDPVAGVGFGVLSRTDTNMTIRVKFSGVSLCTWQAPTVKVKAVKSAGRPGQELRYDLTVTNNSTMCGKQTIELWPSKKPTGWTVTISKKSKITASLLPGQSKRFIVRIVSARKSKYPKYSVKIETRMVQNTARKTISALQPKIKTVK